MLNEKTASQIAVHKKYGGVVPEIAGRLHAEKIVPLIEEILKGNLRPDAIAVTAGPGLITGLIVGVEAAKALSYAWNIPLVAVNHIEGHVYSVKITNHKSQITNKLKYPAIALIVSGGHTELILIKKEGQYKLLGKTKDDAAGECFDKVAKLLRLPYPGGPQISKLAVKGNPKAINFPRPMMSNKYFSAKGGPASGWDFSFSGLKTSALYYLRDNPKVNHANFCASFEQAIIDVLAGKTINAAKEYNPKTIIVGGGVSANKKLRETLSEKITAQFSKAKLLFPDSKYCMDNAAMIALAGYKQAQRKKFTPWRKIKADPNWELAN